MADSQTVIASRHVVRGRVSGDGDLVVAGRVEGEVALNGTLHVEPGGVVAADIDVANAFVAGTLVGSANVRGTIEVDSGGQLAGDVTAPQLLVHDGARLHARLDVGDVAAEPRGQKAYVTTSRRPTAAAFATPRPAVTASPAVVEESAPAAADEEEEAATMAPDDGANEAVVPEIVEAEASAGDDEKKKEE